MNQKAKFPGALWLLPVFFGILGGIAASLVASMKYKATWFWLLAVGIVVTVLQVLAYNAVMESILSVLSS